MDEKPKIKVSVEAEQFDADNELWESKQLGVSAEHARPASKEQEQALDDATGLQLLSIRMPKSLIEQVKQLAKLEGIGYQPYMRKVMTQHVRENEHKLEQLLTPAEATAKADRLFAQALTLKAQIPGMQRLSNERILAEGDYNQALTEANFLFCNAYENADPVLKRHVKLRMSQIADILDQEIQDFHDEKYGKKRPAESSEGG